MIAEYTWRGAHIYDDKNELLDITDYKFYFNSQTGQVDMFEIALLNKPVRIIESFNIKDSHKRFKNLNSFVDYCEKFITDKTNEIGRCDDRYDYIIRSFYDDVGTNLHRVKKYISDKSGTLLEKEN